MGCFLEELQKFFPGRLDGVVDGAEILTLAPCDFPHGQTARKHQKAALLNARKMGERLTHTGIALLAVIEHLLCKIGSAVFRSLIDDDVQGVAVAAFLSVARFLFAAGIDIKLYLSMYNKD